jgi:hypothetical protein
MPLRDNPIVRNPTRGKSGSCSPATNGLYLILIVFGRTTKKPIQARKTQKAAVLNTSGWGLPEKPGVRSSILRLGTTPPFVRQWLRYELGVEHSVLFTQVNHSTLKSSNYVRYASEHFRVR